MKYLYDCQLDSLQSKPHHVAHFPQLIKKKIQLAAWHFGKYEQENDMFI